MRSPKGNVRFIRKWYKTSTIPRLKELGYKSLEEINRCVFISRWLDDLYAKEGSRYVQAELFEYIINSRKNEQEIH
jgi:hypothetical protein